MLGIVSLWLNMIWYEAHSYILIIHPTKVTFCEPRIPLVGIGLCPLEDVWCEEEDLPFSLLWCTQNLYLHICVLEPSVNSWWVYPQCPQERGFHKKGQEKQFYFAPWSGWSLTGSISASQFVSHLIGYALLTFPVFYYGQGSQWCWHYVGSGCTAPFVCTLFLLYNHSGRSSKH